MTSGKACRLSLCRRPSDFEVEIGLIALAKSPVLSMGEGQDTKTGALIVQHLVLVVLSCGADIDDKMTGFLLSLMLFSVLQVSLGAVRAPSHWVIGSQSSDLFGYCLGPAQKLPD